MQQQLNNIQFELERIREVLEQQFGVNVDENPEQDAVLTFVRNNRSPTKNTALETWAKQSGVSTFRLKQYLEQLRRRGEIYQPRVDQWMYI